MIILSECSPKFSQNEIELIFSKYGLDLPDDFLKFYQSYNGGIPNKDEVKGDKNIFPVHQFDSIKEILFYKQDLDSYTVPEKLDHKKTLPFACDQGGNTYALFFDGKHPSVVFYTTSDEMTVHGRWDSFSNFLSSFQ